MSALRCLDEYNKYSASWTYMLDSFMIPLDADGALEALAN